MTVQGEKGSTHLAYALGVLPAHVLILAKIPPFGGRCLHVDPLVVA